MMHKKKMIDVFPTPFTTGLFVAMDELNPPPPWHAMDINTELDMEYFGNISGNKYISTLIEKLLITYERETLNAEMVSILASICLKINRKKWQKLFATLDFEYNPIENYNMKERMTNDQTVRETSKSFNGSISDNAENAHTGTVNKTDTLDHTEIIDDTTSKTGTETTAGTLAKTGTETTAGTLAKTGTDTTAGTLAKTGTDTTAETRTKTGTETESPNITTTKNMDIYGFNSSNASNANDETDITTGETEKEYDLAEGRNETITHNTTDTKSETITHNTTDTKSETLTHDVTDTENKTLTHNVTDDTDTSIDIDSTNTSAETRNLTDTIERTQETENSETGEDTTTRNYLLQRTGNIGVTTTQQMIEQERNIWAWDYFRNVVFHDVDLILTLSHYEYEGVI